MSFLTLKRGNAVGDAPHQKSAPRRTFRAGRRVSTTACRCGASHDSRDYRSATQTVGAITARSDTSGALFSLRSASFLRSPLEHPAGVR
ncbi:DUF1534 domain-containing protein [Pseudomonas coronafaciens pv. oryzae str. 1_6]|nr:DUF1534 domain-containing protein [Pseudomonas coronafaciens pv. oryzae str. 1_6]